MTEKESDLPPLEDKDYTTQSIFIFSLIIGPALLIYVVLTCYCKYKRKQRKEAEQKARQD